MLSNECAGVDELPQLAQIEDLVWPDEICRWCLGPADICVCESPCPERSCFAVDWEVFRHAALS